ncbi:ribonuclease H-like domain-containing protein [Paenibacillus harenae]|uniref:ribonuclease H-like domain-containing protein n=1 Tax=Paenibacillus harenae TaxID=306543 RepID=UPI00278D1852|nr:ribonuclease H-like domain-containing protein [Paenibacillus harenae]MDQ0058027.1 uncharacterized protein YprB with RNaseH-like and TPR domain [Paenibacillus harenae]
MSGLRDRMNRLRGSGGSEQAVENADVAARVMDEQAAIVQEIEEDIEQLSPKWKELGVGLQTNETGQFLLRKIVYPLHHRHGTHTLAELELVADKLGAFHPGQTQGAMANRIMFLDLETTGLGVGAGNVPFMVGLAYQTDEGIIVEQAVIRHPAEERAMIAYLSEKLSDYAYLATYNGKTFDWPVMQNRFILNGFNRKMWQPLHLDFLHPARSIWRNTLISCKLSHVEEERLGITRHDDVPGSLAPQLYFEFLATGEPMTLEGVFRHNETDMLSLVSLAIRFGHLLGDMEGATFESPDLPEEMVRTGLWLEKMGNYKLPDVLFEGALRSESPAPAALLMLAARDKKAGNWGRAVVLWQKVIIHSSQAYGSFAIEACTELAMYYEHKLKDFKTALQYAREALEHMRSHPLQRRDAKKSAELEALRKRIARLTGKAERHGLL